MNSVVVGLLLAMGVGGWTFEKTMRRTGRNTKSALTLGAVVGVIAFVFGLTVMVMVNSLTNG